MARVFQLSWFKQAKKLPVREIRRKSGFHSLQLTSRAGRWGFRSHASFDKGVLGWNGKSDFHTLCLGYGTQAAKTPTPLVEVKTSANLPEDRSSPSMFGTQSEISISSTSKTPLAIFEAGGSLRNCTIPPASRIEEPRTRWHALQRRTPARSAPAFSPQ
jgi:hypothetical protein